MWNGIVEAGPAVPQQSEAQMELQLAQTGAVLDHGMSINETRDTAAGLTPTSPERRRSKGQGDPGDNLVQHDLGNEFSRSGAIEFCKEQGGRLA